jgi:hypothetical protein
MQLKTYPTLGCCGLDCGLCPRYYTEGSSRCPGCSGPEFSSKHPSCPFVTCCVKKKGLEVCAQCDEFPCDRTEDSEHVGDSFISHRKTFTNLVYIKEHGLESFITQQRKKIELLELMLDEFDDGRSKSFYCLAAVLLPPDIIELSLERCREEMRASGIDGDDKKQIAKLLKEKLNKAAENAGIELKLRKR